METIGCPWGWEKEIKKRAWESNLQLLKIKNWIKLQGDNEVEDFQEYGQKLWGSHVAL